MEEYKNQCKTEYSTSCQTEYNTQVNIKPNPGQLLSINEELFFVQCKTEYEELCETTDHQKCHTEHNQVECFYSPSGPVEM